MMESLARPAIRPGEGEALGEEELYAVFRQAEVPRSRWRIGMEAERFGVSRSNGEALQYGTAECGVGWLFAELVEHHGWVPDREFPGGPTIALRRGSSAITLEPGAQFELSGAPHEAIHAVAQEWQEHLTELDGLAGAAHIAWLGVGFQPLARQSDLGWVPKQRYRVMREYLPTRGSGALDMMRRTATVQANFDFSDERDAMRKLRVLLRLAPIAQAMVGNAPFAEGRIAGLKSLRQDVWRRMDPDRSGLIPPLWGERLPTYEDYIRWALEAGMFLFKRDDQVIVNAGQSFRGFLHNGFEGHRATAADWKLHLGTLFPEARLKTTIEVRCCDALPRHLTASVPALYAGILYDDKALNQAEELALRFSLEDAEALRARVPLKGLQAQSRHGSAQTLAELLLDTASGGLQRRALTDESGRDERVHLEPLIALVASGRSPADELLAKAPSGELSPQWLIENCRL